MIGCVPIIELLIIVACVLFNAVFASVEMAFVAAPRSSIREIASKGDKRARCLLDLRNSPERTLSVVQIGISLVGAIAAAVGGVSAEEVISPYLETRFGLSEGLAEFLAISILVIPLTYFSIVIGELVPKTLALRNSLRIALHASKWLFLLDRAFGPIISLLEGSTKLILKTFFPKTRDKPTATEIESIQLDSLSPQNRQYVFNLMDIEKKKVRDILLPWDHVICVGIGETSEEVAKKIIAAGHTRLPVVRDESVVGMLHTKEFVTFKESGATDWLLLIRPILSTSLAEPILKVLRQMQVERCHMAIVIEDHKPIGIVTLEDIFEELVGDIFDEDDDGMIRRILEAKAKLKKATAK